MIKYFQMRLTQRNLPARCLFWVVFGYDLLILAGVAIVCLCVGLLINQYRAIPLPLTYIFKRDQIDKVVNKFSTNPSLVLEHVHVQQDASSDKLPRTISMKEFRELWQKKQAVIFDARPEIFYRLGHVPSALSLSREQFESDYARLRTQLESLRGKLVVVYCSDASCEDSQMVGNALTKLKYYPVFIFKGGWVEWTQAGMPEEKL